MYYRNDPSEYNILFHWIAGIDKDLIVKNMLHSTIY